MTAEPLILSKKEVLMKLWEAREQLEAEALAARDSSQTPPQNVGSQNAVNAPAAVAPTVSDAKSVVDTQAEAAASTTHDAIVTAVSNDVKEKEAVLKTPVKAAESRPTPNLMSPEVTEGLERLLSEWPYFKGSGMLGFGPGGMQHPTYQKIAGIPVRHVLTGRFDNPDQDLINEIREYVGGWRREQGVEPEEGETFEMYLRRVIATILDKRASIDARTA